MLVTFASVGLYRSNQSSTLQSKASFLNPSALLTTAFGSSSEQNKGRQTLSKNFFNWISTSLLIGTLASFLAIAQTKKLDDLEKQIEGQGIEVSKLLNGINPGSDTFLLNNTSPRR